MGPAAPSTCSQTTPPLQQPKRVGKVPILGVWVLVRGVCALCTCCMSHANWALNGSLLQALAAGSCWGQQLAGANLYPSSGFPSLGNQVSLKLLSQCCWGLVVHWLCEPRIFLPKKESSFSLPSFLKHCLGFVVLVTKEALSNTVPVILARQRRFCTLQTRERHSCSVFCLFCLDNFLLPVIRLLLGLFSRGGTLVSLSLFHRHTLTDFPMVVCGNNESPVHGNAHEIVLVTHN